MSRGTEEGDGAGLPLLRFCAGGILFCADAGQVEGVTGSDGTAWDPFVWLRDELGCSGLTEYGMPVLFTVKTGTGLPYRVAVDRMDDICLVACREMRPFPPLVEPFALEMGLWGVAFPGGERALLIDFLLLERKKRT